MMKIALCDDKLDALMMLSQYLTRMKKKIQYEVFQDPLQLLHRVDQEKTEFDIYLLDIEMPHMDGIELARRIRREDSRAIIIFQTSHVETVFETFKVQAHRFLQKPVEYAPFLEAIESSYPLIREKKQFFDFIYQHQSMRISSSEIIYIESNLRKITIHTMEQEYCCYMSMKEVLDQLNTHVFVRIGVSYVVNMAFIKAIQKDNLITKQNHMLPISKKYQKDIKNMQLQYEMARI